MAKKKNLDIDKWQPQLLGLEEQISRLKSEIKRCNWEIDTKKDANKKHLEEMKRLQSALADVTSAIEDLNEQGQDKGVKLQLADHRVQEYHRM
jgi:structural maintenance of chromosome 1